MKKFLFILMIISGSISLRAAGIETDTTKHTAAAPKIGKDCEKIDAIYVIIAQAIDAGAPTYNAGNHLACYMIYEGAAYKILHKYGGRCVDVSNILESALEKSYGNYSATDKAWIMRMAFDEILGEPTKTK